MDTKKIDAAAPDVKPVDGDGATILCSLPAAKVQAVSYSIDEKGGMLAKSVSVKHLSTLLSNEINDLLDPDKGEKVGKDAQKFTINESTRDQLLWLAAEVSEISGDLAEQVDDLEIVFVEFSNAAYYAMHDEVGAPITTGKAVRP